jgi:hypothetical protein
MSNIAEYGTNFKFDKAKNEEISDLQFYKTGECVYAIWVGKYDNGIYLSVSINSGQKFSDPQKVMNTNGDVRGLQILAKDEQFVIALIETISDSDSKRAVSGWLNIAGKTFSFKPCTSHRADGELINIFLSFNGNDSVDHMVIKKDDGLINEVSMGHSCSPKELKDTPITTARL